MRTRGRTGYQREHARSIAAKARPPRNLLAWLIREYREEMPEELHTGGVWRDRVNEREAERGITAVGGSLLGSPRIAEGVRRLTEESPFTTEVAEYEGHKDPHNHYVFPLRAALARLGGRGKATDEYPFMAYALLTTARLDGDWDRALSSLGVNPPAVRRVYLERALRCLWDKYEPEPSLRVA